MTDKYEFDYFYGVQSEQFSFFRLPKVIVRDERFKKLSSDAKILYGIMLDRMSLSRENRWFDKNNRVYIIFTLNDVMKEFECSKRKAGMLMAELDTKAGVGLIEKKRQGLGKPDLIYLKNFITPKEIPQPEEKPAEEPQGEVLPFQSGKNVQLQNGNKLHIQSGNPLPHQNCKTMPHKNGNTLPFQSGNDVPPNNTEYNQPNCNENESINPIHPSHHTDEMETIAFYRKLVLENIGYNGLYMSLSILKQQILNEIVELMVEVLAVNRKSIRIAGADYPYPFVRSRFLSIGQDHVEYVLNCLERTSSRIGNIKAYLLTSLFNSVATVDTYYTTAVNHDLTEDISG